MKRRLSNQAGFTLIELVVTMTIIAIGVVAVVEIFINTDGLNRQSRNLALATEAAQQIVETDRNLSYSAIPASQDFTSSLPAQLGSPRSGTATFNDLSPVVSGLKQLDVVITYTDGNVLRKAQVSTLIAQQGINK